MLSTLRGWFRPTVGVRHHITDDLDLGAYLVLRGAKLQSWEYLDNGFKQFAFTHPQMLRVLADWHAHAPIRFSPKAFLEHRYHLKFIDRRRLAPFGAPREPLTHHNPLFSKPLRQTADEALSPAA